MSKFTSFISLIRPVNCLMMGAAVIVGGLIAAQLTAPTILIFGFITAFMLTAASMVINDYYDREVDALNAPNRPIPSGAISPSEALIYATILGVIGLIAAFYTGFIALTVAVIFFALALAYNTEGKKTGLLGNFMVSACIAIPFIYGGLIVRKGGEKLLVIFALLALLANMGREVTKGMTDVEGDKLRRVKTIAILFGLRSAAQVAALFYISAVVLSLVPWVLNLVSFLYLPLVMLADVGFVVSSILLTRNPSEENAKRIKTLVLIWMMMGLAAFMAGGY